MSSAKPEDPSVSWPPSGSLDQYDRALREVRRGHLIAQRRAREARRAYGAPFVSRNQVQQTVVIQVWRKSRQLDLGKEQIADLVGGILTAPHTPLLSACLQGLHPRAWEEIATRLARLSTGRPGFGDDVLSEAYLALWQGALWRFDGCRSLDAYLWGVMRVLRRRVHSRLLPPPRMLPTPIPEPDPALSAERRDLARRCFKLLESFPGLPCRLLLRHAVDGATFREIAETEGFRSFQAAHRMYWKLIEDLRGRLE